MRTLARPLAVLGAAALLLAGCTAPQPAPTADPAVLAQDCTALSQTLAESIRAISGTTAEQIAADPSGAIDLLEGAVDAIETAAADVRDAELKAEAESTVTVMRDYVSTLRTAAEDPANADRTLVVAQAALVQDQLKKVVTLCS